MIPGGSSNHYVICEGNTETTGLLPGVEGEKKTSYVPSNRRKRYPGHLNPLDAIAEMMRPQWRNDVSGGSR